MRYVHRCIIVPAEQSELARVLCETLAGPGGSGMFTTPLSQDGHAPATHYISSGMIESEFAQLLASTVEQICAYAQSLGIAVSCEVLAGILAASDVSDDSADVAMARLGLMTLAQLGNLM